MKMIQKSLPHIFVVVLAVLANLPETAAQHRTGTVKPGPVVFAVLNDGKTIESIGYIDKGAIEKAVDGASEAPIISRFHRSYFKPGTVYKLVFGGADAGTVTVKSSNPKAECLASSAEVVSRSTSAKLSGRRMALATNIAPRKAGTGMRRMPTAAERTEIGELVKAEFERQKAGGKKVDYHNLTAIDVDNDKKPEFVGTYWTNIDAETRALLFFIADKGSDGKYKFGITDYRVVKQSEVMNGEISAVDKGMYHELLLDELDIDGDGKDEVFTYIQSFEGAGFNAYSLIDGKWERVFEGANYHCGY